MTNAELRAAAEMVVATGMHKEWADTIDAGAVAVCQAWLAEHDETPLTESWLMLSGFETRPRSPRWLDLGALLVQPTYIDTLEEARWSIFAWRNAIPTELVPKTRGDVRRLCAALGIELRATP